VSGRTVPKRTHKEFEVEMSHIAASPQAVRARAVHLLIVLALLAVPVAACTAPGLIIGDILKGLSNDVSSVIQNAGAEAQAVELTAAGAVDDAINNATSAFATVLDKGMNQVDSSVRQAIEQLQQLVAQLRSGTLELVRATITGSQQLINSLPFTNKNPQVTSYSPRFTATTPGQSGRDGRPRELRVGVREETQPDVEGWRGHLPAQPRDHPGARLLRAGQPFHVEGCDRAGVAGAGDSLRAGPRVQVGGPWCVPTARGRAAGFPGAQPGADTDHLVVGNSDEDDDGAPGAAESGGGWHLDSFDCRDHSLTQSVRADPGWTIQPSTAAIGYSWNKNPGGANVSLVSGQSQIVVKANTYARCFLGISNGSGSITFYLTYTQEQPWQSGKEETIPLTIRWGDKLVVPVPPGHWQLNAQLSTGAPCSSGRPIPRINS
jgi:hypothetical protein